ncbi:hypothetical protein MTsPCn5_27490 [Croceitalea sp. MTPC5]|nr:hypothetical protein MTsPCn5_27490 [Croceitalea sp. MTPC5]
MLDIWKHDSYQHIFKKSIHKTTINNLKKSKMIALVKFIVTLVLSLIAIAI